MPVSAQELFAWHERPGAFERLMPPWDRIEVVSREGSIHDGDRLIMRLRQGPLKLIWEALHSNYVAGQRFTDRQVRGPFKFWEHTHECIALENATSTLRDSIEYRLPMGAIGRRMGGEFVAGMLANMFAFRHARTRLDLERHAAARARVPDAMRIAMSGSSGAIGSELVHFLTGGGHSVDRLVRRSPKAGEIFWQPGAGIRGGQIDDAGLEGCDAVIHLAGEPVAAGRWTAARMKAIRDSRVDGTRLIARTAANLKKRPSVLIVASGVHYYGDRGDQEMTEEAGIGSGFLAEVSRDWEGAVAPAVDAGIRVVLLRIGLVLSPRGGPLSAMLRFARLGLLPVLGSGRQWWSWISSDDLLGVILYALTNPSLSGPVNAITPQPVRMAEFAHHVARSVDRPLAMRVPAWMLRGVLGEQAEMITTSTRAAPDALRLAGFRFMHPGLADALAWEMRGRSRLLMPA